MTRVLRYSYLSARFITTMTLSDFHFSTVFTGCPSKMEIPCSVIKPSCSSCHLYNGGHIANKQVFAILFPTSIRKCGFAQQLVSFVTSSVIHLYSSPAKLPDGFHPPFPCPFTTAVLQLLQRRAVWISCLYSISDTSNQLALLTLYHLYYSILKNVVSLL